MIKRLLLIATLGVALLGCYMVPMALIGPASSGFTTASIMKSGISSGTNYLIKKSTGKTISEHVFGSVKGEVLIQSYLPQNKISKLKTPSNSSLPK